MHHHRQLLVIVALVSVLLGGCARRVAQEPAAQPPERPATTAPTAEFTAVEHSLNVDSVTRTYRLFAPAGANSAPSLALVINLHGFNSDAVQQEQVSQMSRLAATAGFAVVYPQALGDPPSWKFGRRAAAQSDVAFLRAMIAEIQGQLAIDPRRIYVTGISNGAEMAYHVACELPDVIAAFATVAGGYPPVTQCAATRPIPVVAFHGTNDNILPYSGKPPLLLPVETWAADWARRNGCSEPPEVTLQSPEVTRHLWGSCEAGAEVVLYTIADKGHSWPGSSMPAAITTQELDATEVIWTFFMEHPRALVRLS